MFWEVAMHFLALDLPWIAGFLVDNLVFIFMLFAAIYITSNGKKVFANFITFSIIILVSRDLAPYFNLAIYTGAGLMILYLFRLSVFSFLFQSRYAKYFKLVWFLSFYIVLYFYNVFFVW